MNKTKIVFKEQFPLSQCFLCCGPCSQHCVYSSSFNLRNKITEKKLTLPRSTEEREGTGRLGNLGKVTQPASDS